MNQLPPGGRTGPLHWFPVGTPQEPRYACVSAAPSLAVAQDRAKASLLASPAGAMLAVEAVWQAADADLAAARQQIASSHPDDGEVDLRPADLQDVKATLTIEGHGARHEAGPFPASGTSANRVAISIPLTAAEKTAALGAFGGTAGALTLRYTARLVIAGSAVVQVSGDLAAIVKALAPKAPPEEETSGGFFSFTRKKPAPPPPPPPPPTLAGCRAAIDDAIASGQIQLIDASSVHAPQQAREQAAADLRARLARQVHDKLQQMGADAVYLSSFPVQLSSDTPADLALDIQAEADLGPLLQQHGGASLVEHTDSPLPEPAR